MKYPLKYGLTILFFMSLLSVGMAASASPQSPTLGEVSQELSCQCGCGLVLGNCNHTNCGSAIPMRKEIQKLIDQGKNREEIIATMVSRHGEQVLAAPTTVGFNLVAWIAPFTVLLLGGIFVTYVILSWLHKRPIQEKVSPQAKKLPADDYDERIELELREFD